VIVFCALSSERDLILEQRLSASAAFVFFNGAEAPFILAMLFFIRSLKRTGMDNLYKIKTI